MAAALTFRSLGKPRENYPQWVRDLAGKSGVYVLALDGRVVYVGESHSDALYDTLTRHAQGWSRRKRFWTTAGYSRHDPGLTYPRERLTAWVRVTTAAEAMPAQTALIRRLRPKDNIAENPGKPKRRERNAAGLPDPPF